LDMLRAHARRMSRTDLELIVSHTGSRQRTAVG
jgi:hypothetical protein